MSPCETFPGHRQGVPSPSPEFPSQLSLLLFVRAEHNTLKSLFTILVSILAPQPGVVFEVSGCRLCFKVLGSLGGIACGCHSVLGMTPGTPQRGYVSVAGELRPRKVGDAVEPLRASEPPSVTSATEGSRVPGTCRRRTSKKGMMKGSVSFVMASRLLKIITMTSQWVNLNISFPSMHQQLHLYIQSTISNNTLFLCVGEQNLE